MNSDVMDAIGGWDACWNEAQRAAVTVMQAAFPPLVEQSRYVGCHPFRLEYEEEGFGAGRVCIDADGRVRVEFRDVPNKVIAEAVGSMRLLHIAPAGGLLVEALSGTYVYECELSYAQFEFVLAEGGFGRVDVMNATVPDAAAVLMALTETAKTAAS
ncbi:hypothetical protein ACIQU6_28060 [Streptomyces sp. NPDC090442]|uniref:hypothetical protein n=1 Tax=Streptomyces sp. NPDC090442 TaxID=3365962 RepID=UPI003826E4B4